jgi:predicted ATPase/DNA-binding CsgD family transcriptional regulator
MVFLAGRPALSWGLRVACRYGTAVVEGAAGAAGGVHGFAPAMTSFVGRAAEVDEVAGLVGKYRLVTMTGPGGVGKTRLATVVARAVAGRFADGVWLAELAAVGDPAMTAVAVAAALGVQQGRGGSPVAALGEVLARRQLLVVLDNCEHVLGAAAELCGTLLPAADDVRVLATSREPLGLAGEARYRLGPLGLPGPGAAGDGAGSEAVALFADRARQFDPHFTVDGESLPAVTRLVRRLDGVPLAIELAAARVEALGMAQLLERLDDRFALLAGTDRTVAPRQRSLAATVDWSYQLLSEHERLVFRRLAVFPGPFTLPAAAAVAGAAAERAVLHLVDCSLLVPPRPGPDGRARYVMLETLRAYGLDRLTDAGEQPEAAAALAGHALQVVGRAAAGLATATGEVAAARLLEAEDATVQQGLAWALEHDHGTALRLAVTLAPWWWLRGRWASGYRLLAAAAGEAAPGGEEWCTAQFWLGVLTGGSDVATSFGHLTAARDAVAGRAPVPLLAWALAWRAVALANLGRLREAAEEARRALALARDLSDPAGEAYALFCLAAVAGYAGDSQANAAWARQVQRIDRAAIPGWIARQCTRLLAEALGDAGEAAAAQRYCADALASARQAGAVYDQGDCLGTMAWLDVRAGRLAAAAAHLREALELYSQTTASLLLANCLDTCGDLCAATRHWPEAITVWAASDAVGRAAQMHSWELTAVVAHRQEPLRKARQALGSAQARAAGERGAAMTAATAAEYALLLVTDQPHELAAAPGLPRLSARERELVTLVARGRTDAQIAEQLYISVATVRSHLDRIRDKTGCRRRADLTRLALTAGLI